MTSGNEARSRCTVTAEKRHRKAIWHRRRDGTRCYLFDRSIYAPRQMPSFTATDGAVKQRTRLGNLQNAVRVSKIYCVTPCCPRSNSTGMKLLKFLLRRRIHQLRHISSTNPPHTSFSVRESNLHFTFYPSILSDSGGINIIMMDQCHTHEFIYSYHCQCAQYNSLSRKPTNSSYIHITIRVIPAYAYRTSTFLSILFFIHDHFRDDYELYAKRNT